MLYSDLCFIQIYALFSSCFFADLWSTQFLRGAPPTLHCGIALECNFWLDLPVHSSRGWICEPFRGPEAYYARRSFELSQAGIALVGFLTPLYTALRIGAWVPPCTFCRIRDYIINHRTRRQGLYASYFCGIFLENVTFAQTLIFTGKNANRKGAFLTSFLTLSETT